MLHDHLNDEMIAQSNLADDESSLALQSRASGTTNSALESQATGRRIIWTIAGVALLVLVGGFLFRPSNNVDPSVIPEIVRLDGKVDIRLADGTANAAKIGDRIRPGETVAAQGNDFGSVSAALKYPDGTKVHLVSATTLTNRSARSKQMEIDQGTVLASVTPQPAKHPMLFTAKKLQVKVLGTDLVLAHNERYDRR